MVAARLSRIEQSDSLRRLAALTVVVCHCFRSASRIHGDRTRLADQHPP